jgi:hypothetical protein
MFLDDGRFFPAAGEVFYTQCRAGLYSTAKRLAGPRYYSGRRRLFSARGPALAENTRRWGGSAQRFSGRQDAKRITHW